MKISGKNFRKQLLARICKKTPAPGREGVQGRVSGAYGGVCQWYIPDLARLLYYCRYNPQKRTHMNIQVSKVFVNFINKTAKEMGFECEAVLEYIPQSTYQWTVGDLWDGEQDYDWEKCKYKVITILYPAEYYACPMHLTTARLCAEFRRRGVSTMQELKEMIRDMVEI